MDISVVESMLRKILSAIEHPTLRVDARHRLHAMKPARKYAGSLHVNDAVLTSANQERIEPTTEMVGIPVLAPASFLAPRINPTLWGDYCPIKTMNPIPSDPPRTSWQGKISEKVSVYLGTSSFEFHERLRVNFTLKVEDSQVLFSLSKSFSGFLLVDEGFIRASPNTLGFLSTLAVEKTVILDSEFWRNLPEFLRQEILKLALIYWFGIYSVRVTLDFLRQPEGKKFIDQLNKADFRRYLDQLKALEDGSDVRLLSQAIDAK